MFTRRASISTGIVTSLCLLAGVAWSLLGFQAPPNKPVETLHPAHPVFLYVFDGLATHQQSWDTTGSKKALIDSGLGAHLDKLLTFLAVEVGGAGAESVRKMFVRSLDQGASLSVSLDTSNAVPAPQMTLILHGSAGLEEPLVQQLIAGPLKDLQQKSEMIGSRKVTRIAIPKVPGAEVGWWTDGGHLVMAAGVKAIESALAVADGTAANLSTNAIVQKLRADQELDVVAVGLVDIPPLVAASRLMSFPQLIKGKNPCKVIDVLKIAGVDRLGMATGRWGFKEGAFCSDTTIQAPAPLTGLMTLFDQRPLTLADLPAIPANCEHFTLMRFDAEQLLKAILQMSQEGLDKFGPVGTPSAKELLSQVNAQLGFDLNKDLAEPLGDTVTYYLESGDWVPTATVLVKLDGAVEVLETLLRLEELALSGAAPEWLGAVQFRTKPVGRRTIHIIQISGQAFLNPAWTLHGDWLVIGTTPQSVETYMKRADGKLPKWEASADLIAAQKMLPEKFVSLTYSDPRSAIRYAINLAPTGIALLDMGIAELGKKGAATGQGVTRTTKFPIGPEDIPLAEEVTTPLFANVAVCSVDADGIHWHSRNALPGLPIPTIPGGGGGIETVGLATLLFAALAPAVETAHHAGQLIRATNKLRRIAISLLNYETANQQLPPGTLENKDAKTPEEHLSWIIELLPNLDHMEVYDSIRKEKNFADDANKKVWLTKLDVFIDPSQTTAEGVNDYGQTTYVGIAGIGKDAPFLKVEDPRAGMFGYGRKTMLRDVKDGVSYTMMLSSIYKDFGPWGQGGPATIRSLTTKPYINGPDGLGSGSTGTRAGLIALADGSVRSISENIDPSVFEALATMAGGEKVGEY